MSDRCDQCNVVADELLSHDNDRWLCARCDQRAIKRLVNQGVLDAHLLDLAAIAESHTIVCGTKGAS